MNFQFILAYAYEYQLFIKYASELQILKFNLISMLFF
jgi:hypothetical protein